MMSNVKGLWFAICLVGVFAWAQSPSVQDDEARIRAVNKAFLATLKAGDLDAHMALYARDAEVYFPGQKPLFGIDAIRHTRAQNLSQVDLVRGAIFTDRLDIDGGTAYARGRFSYTLRRKEDDAKPWSYSGLFLLILKKQPDGSWKIKVDGGFPSPE
ncbi:YybH family protein [Acanthopleuribacter pedis]|uniref:DUF4440 domain-containing protein n=1 Tax=Acanthopleuribacter pedis TaxID=442870 RepID=A0A8J7QJB0_9BACT|nr:DUF4440 domain-containing protein [Acanthopleuribacter pedis]MBO1321866.1 DUF4440 domain-containing protein [Acanthopleuribacter pedis]